MKGKMIVYGLFVLLSVSSIQAQDLLFELEPEAFPLTIEGWQPHCPWTGGIDASTPEFCDIDADGDLDYFSGSDLNYYSFFENSGNHDYPDFKYVSLTFDSLYPVCPGINYFSDIDFCDIDNDGDYDAMLSNGSIGLAVNLGNNTQYTFSPPFDTLRDQYGDYLLASNMAAIDIDDDGDIDLFGGTWYSGEIRFFENVGSSQVYEYHLITETWQDIQVSGGVTDPCFKDLDNDGDFDLIIGDGEGTLFYYRNDGTSTNPQMTLVSDNYLDLDVGDDASPELADINGDGDFDLFVGRSPDFGSEMMGNIYYLENVGNSTEPDFQFVTTNYLYLDIGKYSFPNLIDIDADHDIDLLTTIYPHIGLFRNHGDSLNPNFYFETETFEDISESGALIPWFADIDDDSDYDLFVGPGAIPGPPGLRLYMNQGTPYEPEFVLYSDDLVPGVFNTSSVALSPATADIDADGDFDLFVSDDNGNFYFFENTGTSTNFQFQYITDNWQNIFDGRYDRRTFCFYDIDHDQDLDLFYNSTSVWNEPWDKNLRFYRNIGTPENANIVLEIDDLFPELMIHQAAPYLIDIDLDGDGDMFVGDTYGGIRFFRNQEFSSVSDNPKIQSFAFTLHPNYPNPFNAKTVIPFTLDFSGRVSLNIFNINGQSVGAKGISPALPTQTWYPAGSHEIIWNAEGVSSGVYLVRLSVEGMTDRNVCPTRKAVLLK